MAANAQNVNPAVAAVMAYFQNPHNEGAGNALRAGLQNGTINAMHVASVSLAAAKDNADKLAIAQDRVNRVFGILHDHVLDARAKKVYDSIKTTCWGGVKGVVTWELWKRNWIGGGTAFTIAGYTSYQTYQAIVGAAPKVLDHDVMDQNGVYQETIPGENIFNRAVERVSGATRGMFAPNAERPPVLDQPAEVDQEIYEVLEVNIAPLATRVVGQFCDQVNNIARTIDNVGSLATAVRDLASRTFSGICTSFLNHFRAQLYLE